MSKKVVFIDLDGTLADYRGRADELGLSYKDAKREVGFFASLKPIKGAIEAYVELSKHFDVFILSTSPWSNPIALKEKLEWVQKYLPNAYKNVIFSHRKDLNVGDYLIDDSPRNGAENFGKTVGGEWIHFGNGTFNDWKSVVDYVLTKENIITKYVVYYG